jgi:excisionase family DNA binding protein
VGLLIMYVDGDLAGHLAVAVHRHREVLDQLGYASPPELPGLEETLIKIARGGPGRSGTAAAVRGGNVGGVDHDWLTPEECSVASGLSPRTIGRRISDGSLQSSKIGRSRRVSRIDLEQFMRSRVAAA